MTHITKLIPRNGSPLGRRYKARCETCNIPLHHGEVTYEQAKAHEAAHLARVGK